VELVLVGQLLWLQLQLRLQVRLPQQRLRQQVPPAEAVLLFMGNAAVQLGLVQLVVLLGQLVSDLTNLSLEKKRIY
jgi:hypothetical protein